MGDVIAIMIQNIICLAFGFLIAFVYNWRMALVVLGALPFMVSGSIIYYNTISGGWYERKYGLPTSSAPDKVCSTL